MKVWLAVKSWTYKYIGGLFMEEKAGKTVISIGRVSLVAVLIALLWVWRRAVVGGDTGVELPTGMLHVFDVLCAYVFGSKVASVLKDRVAGKKCQCDGECRCK